MRLLFIKMNENSSGKVVFSVWLMVFYIITSLIIGEYHPFSRAEMYSFFPEKAEIVILTDAYGEPIPLSKFFKYSTADLTHNYDAIQQTITESINNTSIYTDPTGKLLNKQLKSYQCNPIDSYEIRLISLSYKLQTLDIESKKLYETIK
jgi:hypothetical protein